MPVWNAVRRCRCVTLGVLACLSLASSPALAQIGSSLPSEIVRSPNPNASQVSTIQTFVSDRSAALTGDDQAASVRARNDLLAPLDSTGLSVGFRQAYATALMPSVTTLLASDDPTAVASGLRLAGALATDEAVRKLAETARGDDEGLRLLAATRLGRALTTLSTPAPGPTEFGARSAIDVLGELIEESESPVLADAAVRALRPATELKTTDLAGVRNHALAVLGDKAALRARALETDTNDIEQELLVLIRSTALVREAVIDVNASPNREAARGGVALGAAAIGYVTRRLEAGDLPRGDGRRADLELLRAAETVLFYARRSHERAAGQPSRAKQTDLTGLLEKGDERAFRTNVRSLIGPQSELVDSLGFEPRDRFLP